MRTVAEGESDPVDDLSELVTAMSVDSNHRFNCKLTKAIHSSLIPSNGHTHAVHPPSVGKSTILLWLALLLIDWLIVNLCVFACYM